MKVQLGTVTVTAAERAAISRMTGSENGLATREEVISYAHGVIADSLSDEATKVVEEERAAKKAALAAKMEALQAELKAIDEGAEDLMG